MFSYKGPLPASKSWLNRALIIKHFNAQIKINEMSPADDVLSLQKAVELFEQRQATEQIYNLGMGGTSLRFFSFLVSRYAGEFHLQAHERLLQRPQQEIQSVLSQLGIKCEITSQAIVINSDGWKIPACPVRVSANQSSQFISGLLLCCWGLPQQISIEIAKPIQSYSYLKLTIELLKKTGLRFTAEETQNSLCLKIAPEQKSELSFLTAEIDVSSAFSLLAAAVVGGHVGLTNWYEGSSQPDMKFLDFFKQMGIAYQVAGADFVIEKQPEWRGLSADLSECPDLFPVLSVLCALARGDSYLYGAEHLKFKESNRIDKTAELLQLCGFICEKMHDGIKIKGRSGSPMNKKITFSPAHDHRMAMAAAILKLAGWPIEILEPEVVRKSYPDFWAHIGVIP